MNELADGTPQKRYVRSTIFYVSLQESERSQQKTKIISATSLLSMH
jgi:hypothetical protein